MPSFISSIIKKYRNPKVVYKGARFDVLTVEDVFHNKLISRELVSHPGAVVILPFVDDENMLLIKNYRFSVQKTLLELPAGTLEEGEEPIVCAYRELAEETGFEAKKMDLLLEFFPTPGFCNEYMHVFVAHDLKEVGQHLDETEEIDVVKVAFKDALEMVRRGEIKDAKSMTSILYYSQFKS